MILNREVRSVPPRGSAHPLIPKTLSSPVSPVSLQRSPLLYGLCREPMLLLEAELRTQELEAKFSGFQKWISQLKCSRNARLGTAHLLHYHHLPLHFNRSKRRFWASIHTTPINYFMQSPTPPLECLDLSSLPVLPITQPVLSSEPPPPSQQNKPWAFTHPHNIVESPGVQDGTGEVKTVEGFSQGAVTMALRRKNSLGHVLADMSPDSTRKTWPRATQFSKLTGTNHGTSSQLEEAGLSPTEPHLLTSRVAIAQCTLW